MAVSGSMRARAAMPDGEAAAPAADAVRGAARSAETGVCASARNAGVTHSTRTFTQAFIVNKRPPRILCNLMRNCAVLYPQFAFRLSRASRASRLYRLLTCAKILCLALFCGSWAAAQTEVRV